MTLEISSNRYIDWMAHSRSHENCPHQILFRLWSCIQTRFEWEGLETDYVDAAGPVFQRGMNDGPLTLSTKWPAESGPCGNSVPGQVIHLVRTLPQHPVIVNRRTRFNSFDVAKKNGLQRYDVTNFNKMAVDNESLELLFSFFYFERFSFN